MAIVATGKEWPSISTMMPRTPSYINVSDSSRVRASAVERNGTQSLLTARIAAMMSTVENSGLCPTRPDSFARGVGD